MSTLVTTSSKLFPGGKTTAYVLSAEDGTYAVSVITRFDSGNYYTEYKEESMKPADALKTAEYYTR